MLTLVSEFCVLPSPTSRRCTHLPPSLLPRLAHWSIFGCRSPPHRCSPLAKRQACCKPCHAGGWQNLLAQRGCLSVSLCPLYAYQYQVFTPPAERIVGATPFGWYTLPSWGSSKFFLALAVLPTFITVSLHIISSCPSARRLWCCSHRQALPCIVSLPFSSSGLLHGRLSLPLCSVPCGCWSLSSRPPPPTDAQSIHLPLSILAIIYHHHTRVAHPVVAEEVGHGVF